MKTILRFLMFVLLCPFLLSRVCAVEYRKVEHSGKWLIVCTVDPALERLDLFFQDEQGAVLHTFARLEAMLRGRGERLVFGMNAGMFHPGFAPVGLFVAEGRERTPLSTVAGEGNFFLKPNGVFALTDAGAVVVEAARWPGLAGKARLATQSGPMLVIDGNLHPAFRAGSDSRLFRNGVGITPDRKVAFVISMEAVNFYEFATLFRDVLKCRNALFLDGTISALHAPELKRSDAPFPLGPLLGVTEKMAKP